STGPTARLWTTDRVPRRSPAGSTPWEEAFVSHHTAAALWGAVVPHTDKLHLSVPRTVRRAARDDVVVHASSRTPTVFRGLRTTGADDTFLDLARSLGLVDL